MVADTLELRRLTIEEHTLVGDYLQRADTKACGVLVAKLFAYKNL